jgi:hypothetical protein
LIDAERVRARAIDALGALGDSRAREALESAEIAIEPSIATWEGSSGTVHGHRVVVAIDAALLARVRASPATEDALHAALAAAIAEGPRDALHDLRLAWRPHAITATAYRGVAPDSPRAATPLHEAMAAYLGATGDPALVEMAARARVDVVARRGGRMIAVRVDEADRAVIEAAPARVEALRECVRALLGGAEDVDIRVG